MRAGTLDRRVALQRKSATYSDSGQPVETWQTLGTSSRWASKLPVSGTERFSADQFAALEQVEFRIRWSDDISDLQPQDRLIEPASDASESPVPPRSIYDIIAVHELGRREGLRVMATRRVDVL